MFLLAIEFITFLRSAFEIRNLPELLRAYLESLEKHCSQEGLSCELSSQYPILEMQVGAEHLTPKNEQSLLVQYLGMEVCTGLQGDSAI